VIEGPGFGFAKSEKVCGTVSNLIAGSVRREYESNVVGIELIDVVAVGRDDDRDSIDRR
jgi:hypothetical protein